MHYAVGLQSRDTSGLNATIASILTDSIRLLSRPQHGRPQDLDLNGDPRVFIEFDTGVESDSSDGDRDSNPCDESEQLEPDDSDNDNEGDNDNGRYGIGRAIEERGPRTDAPAEDCKGMIDRMRWGYALPWPVSQVIGLVELDLYNQISGFVLGLHLAKWVCAHAHLLAPPTPRCPLLNKLSLK